MSQPAASSDSETSDSDDEVGVEEPGLCGWKAFNEDDS